MEDIMFFRRHASRCYEIARTCMDLDAARKINALGNEFQNKATALENSRRNARSSPLADSDKDFAA